MKPVLRLLPIILAIISLFVTLLGFLLFDIQREPLNVIILAAIGLVLGITALGLVLFEQKKLKKMESPVKKNQLLWIGITLAILVILLNGVTGAVLTSNITNTKKLVSQVRAQEQSFATSIESYYIDNCVYPRPDFEPNDAAILPKSLTTPVAFITQIPHDPFNNNGKGYYGMGVGPLVGCGPKCTWGGSGWIITSYGPDRVDGNSGVIGGGPLKEEEGWRDSTTGGIPLIASPLTYDPTNGLKSPGDVWRRGP